jgi:prevent-host-death family protein
MNRPIPPNREAWIKVRGGPEDAERAVAALVASGIEATPHSYPLATQVHVCESDSAKARSILEKKGLYAGGPHPLSRSGLSAVTAAEARERLADLLNEVAFHGERILISRHGKAIAAIVPAADAEWLEEIEDQADLEDARAARQEIRRKRTAHPDRALRAVRSRR